MPLAFRRGVAYLYQEQGTSHHPQHAHPCADGRLLIRGADAVYCYDLRKPAAK